MTTPRIPSWSHLFWAQAGCGAVVFLASCMPGNPPVAVPAGGQTQERPLIQPLEPDVLMLGVSVPIPADSDLLLQAQDAWDLKQRQTADRVLDAKERGELASHAVVTQFTLDRGILSLDALLILGDDLFEYEFRPEDGLGNGLTGRGHAGNRPAPNMRRVQAENFGGPDSFNCAVCHRKGGLDGAGNTTQNAFFRSDGNSTLAADERNPLPLKGLGPVQALAREMTADLLQQRADAHHTADMTGQDATVALRTHTVEFGSLTARADGSEDTSAVAGVDADLVVRPFGWKGHQAELRKMVEESFHLHGGMLTASQQAQVGNGTVSQADFGDGPGFDVDQDGISTELDDGSLTIVASYLSQLEVPVVRPPWSGSMLERFAVGSRVFETVQCASCHVPTLILVNPVVEYRPDPVAYPDSPPTIINVAENGEFPKAEPVNVLRTGYRVNLFSDLKRHDMGPDLASPHSQGNIPASVFLTRTLWGLAETAPYLHDGRATTLEEAILAHGGEAQASRDAFAAATQEDRTALLVYLLSLTRTPKLLIP